MPPHDPLAANIQSPHMTPEISPSSAWENPVKTLLRQGKPALGVTVTVNHVETAAQAAALGFDFLWIEMEHSPISLDTLRSIVLASRGLKAVPFARVPVNTLWTAKQVLDAGVLGVMFPFTSTGEQARQAAAACKYPPAGRRGSGAGLATFRWSSGNDYYDFADRNVLVVAIIEEAEALANLEEIAATPGIDVLFVGPSDLSFSLGLRGDMKHPRVEAAMARVLAAARQHGKHAGRVATSPEDVQRAVGQGFLFLQAGTELNFMAAGAQQFLEPLGKWCSLANRRPVY
jgi:2-keto-3-deoxy-L-rhamnonate aldolase RhmA